MRPQLWTEPELDEQTRPGLREGHDQCVTGIREQYVTLSWTRVRMTWIKIQNKTESRLVFLEWRMRTWWGSGLLLWL